VAESYVASGFSRTCAPLGNASPEASRPLARNAFHRRARYL